MVASAPDVPRVWPAPSQATAPEATTGAGPNGHDEEHSTAIDFLHFENETEASGLALMPPQVAAGDEPPSDVVERIDGGVLDTAAVAESTGDTAQSLAPQETVLWPAKGSAANELAELSLSDDQDAPSALPRRGIEPGQAPTGAPEGVRRERLGFEHGVATWSELAESAGWTSELREALG
ncbi:MAG: hypothetical protein HY329_00415 [Chloroflexi bacterium]|nr:hypothetical protein [Chloroflexota bacterium]